MAVDLPIEAIKDYRGKPIKNAKTDDAGLQVLDGKGEPVMEDVTAVHVLRVLAAVNIPREIVHDDDAKWQMRLWAAADTENGHITLTRTCYQWLHDLLARRMQPYQVKDETSDDYKKRVANAVPMPLAYYLWPHEYPVILQALTQPDKRTDLLKSED